MRLVGLAQALACAAFAAACAAASAPADAGFAAPAEISAQQDHRRMLDLLGIDTLRPGADGLDPSAPNYANYEEALGNPYPELPDPLRTDDGRAVTSAQMWERVRRPEIVEWFDREIYGRAPAGTPPLTWETTGAGAEMIGAQRALTRRLAGRVDNSFYPLIDVVLDLQVSLPARAREPVPIVLNLLWIDPPPWFRPAPDAADWREAILARGWGVAILAPNSVQADDAAGLTRGIIGLMNHGQPRDLDDWGALRAWAWGASRALDYFETDPAIDASRVAIQGHSRYGKAALIAMAYDRRIAAGFISSSGQGGAKILRRTIGELVENLAGSGEYHWMAGNFLKYAGPLNAGDLPVDAHELIALAAPRPVFISSGSSNGDAWVDARGMFMAAAAAGPVYRLLGARDVGAEEFPPIETALTQGEIAFRQHAGGHTPGPNWPFFLDFAARYFESHEERAP